jgi:hypothetical protein
MSNSVTTSVETFLAQSEVQVGLDITNINDLIGQVKRQQKDSFESMIQLSGKIANAIKWYNSAEGKKNREVDGITWNVADMGKAVFGLGKTQLYNYRKVDTANNGSATLIGDYKEFVKNEVAADVDTELSLKGFLRYATEDAAAVSGGGGEEGEGEGEGAEAKPTVEGSVKFGEIKASFMSDGSIDLKGNSKEDIKIALESMLAQMDVK